MASSEAPVGRRNSSSNTQLLEELEALSQTLYQTHVSTNRRTASLALSRSSNPIPLADEADVAPQRAEEKPRSRRMSMSPWRARPKADPEPATRARESETKFFDDRPASKEKKGIWNWKPVRALAHIGMQKLSCLFSVEVVSVQGLPTSMNGLRLSVCVRKKETKDGAVHTMPSRVSQGAADFEETLFLKCNVYCSQGGGSGSQQKPKFEPRPFIIYVFAVEASELDFGRNTVDLSRLIQEALEKNAEGSRIRQWDISFDLAGKAKGGQLQVKLAFQIMEKDGGIGLFSQLGGSKPSKEKTSSAVGRRQSKSSFSIPSPKLSSRMEVWSPSQAGTTPDIQGIEDLNLDEPASGPSVIETQKSKEEEPEPEVEELELPEFEVVDKGVEVLQSEETKEEDNNKEKTEDGSESSEVVKEIVHDQYLTRLTELDSIAQQIRALESMMSDEVSNHASEETESQKLDADEENVTMEFLHMLEDEEAIEPRQSRVNAPSSFSKQQPKKTADGESKVYVPDLGKALGCVIQTKNGGFLAATNPLNVVMSRKDTPKLAMQMSRPLVLTLDKSIGGFEFFQRMAAVGLDELDSEVLALMPLEELMGKTAEQVAFEGIASAIISGRNKEGATSSAARSIAVIKKMAHAMSIGREERVTTGIWHVSEDPVPADEILAFSMQKIEAMSVDALKVQANMAEDDAPFQVSPLSGKAKDQKQPLASAVPLEKWIENGSTVVKNGDSVFTLVVAIQLRDPVRRYEAVGGPMIALIHTTPDDTKQEKNHEGPKFKVTSLHVGGMKAKKRQKKNSWDSEKQRLTAMQWLIASNMGKAAKRWNIQPASQGQDILWSISSRIVADMWLKSMRNPDVKFTK